MHRPSEPAEAPAIAGLHDRGLSATETFRPSLNDLRAAAVLAGRGGRLLGLRMRSGRHWARITLTVFASLWALSSLVALDRGDTQGFMTAGIPPFFEFPSSYLVLDYARSALDLLAVDAFILLVFLRRSNRYFAARS